MKQDKFVNNRWSGTVFDRFIIASVTTVLVTRIYLASTGYPQVGGGGLHISHMLWGGLAMLAALVLLLAFPEKPIQGWVALLGGLGFGFFIDELGKFITSDNNYFFRPTLALIYIIYVLLLLVFSMLEKRFSMFGQSQETNTELRSTGQTSGSYFQRFSASSYFISTLTIFSVGYILLLIVFGFANLTTATGFVTFVWPGSILLPGVIVLIGIFFLRRSHFTGCVWFKRGVLASIFLNTFFLFSLTSLNLGALEELLVNLIVLGFLKALIRNAQVCRSKIASTNPAIR